MTTAETAPFQFFSLRVDRTRRLGPSLIRVTFTGEDLKNFASGGRDQSLSLFLPHPGQEAPVLPPLDNPDMYAILGAYRAMPAGERAVMRSYTVRA
ncbi:siderophore-interacting protein, partial [Streptomyces sp.]